MFASSRGQYHAMLDQLTVRIEEMGLRWKPESFEYMVIGVGPVSLNERMTIHSVAHAESVGTSKLLEFTRKDYLDVLGVRLDTHGTTMTSVQTRLAIAARSVHTDQNAWKSRASRIARIKAFERHIHPRALHGCRTWHINDKVLHVLRK